MVRYLIISTCFMFFAHTAQADDTTNVVKDKWEDYEHKPKRAALWSLFPGAGQIYNEIGYRRVSNKKHRAWWKVPIIYGGLGATSYYFWYNYTEGRQLREEWEMRVSDTLITASNPFNPKFLDKSTSSLESSYDFFARRRDIFIAATVGIYALNLIEAFVDGHFVSFDVSEDLSLSCFPVMFDRQSAGLNLTLSFHESSSKGAISQQPPLF